jgi:hypothetical protein
MHTNRMQGHWPSLDWEECQDRALTAIHDYPGAIALATFGVGLAVGAAVGLFLSETVPEAAPRRNWPRQTWDAMSQYLPESVKQKIQS